MSATDEEKLYISLEKQINEICNSQSSKCSDVCRQIVFALFLVIGAFGIRDGHFKPNVFLLVSLFFLIVFLILDVSRYFYVLVVFDRLRKGLANTKEKNASIVDYGNKMKDKSFQIKHFTYKIYVVQIWGCLLISFIFIAIGIWF